MPAGQERFAGWLDGLEVFAQPISLAELAERGRLDLIVKGASAVSLGGLGFGKGHGFFDLEWGMFTDIGVADDTTPVAAVVHDVQVIETPPTPNPTDISVEWIFTATRALRTSRALRPCGVKWDLLSPDRIAATPPLRELRTIQAAD